MTEAEIEQEGGGNSLVLCREVDDGAEDGAERICFVSAPDASTDW